MGAVAARWLCLGFSSRMTNNVDESFDSIVTVDDTWCYHFIPEAMAPHYFLLCEVRSAGEVMVTVFWDRNAVLFIDVLNLGTTINLMANPYINFGKRVKLSVWRYKVASRYCTFAHLKKNQSPHRLIWLKFDSPHTLRSEFSPKTERSLERNEIQDERRSCQIP